MPFLATTPALETFSCRYLVLGPPTQVQTILNLFHLIIQPLNGHSQHREFRLCYLYWLNLLFWLFFHHSYRCAFSGSSDPDLQKFISCSYSVIYGLNVHSQ